MSVTSVWATMPALPASAAAAIPVEWLGWAAAGLTLATFVCSDMRRLRLLALAANAAFIAYGASAQLLPVLMLHLALVPVNLWRLNEAFRGTPRPAFAARRESAWPGSADAPARRRRPRSWRRREHTAQAVAGGGADCGDSVGARQATPPGRVPSTAASASAVMPAVASGLRPSARSVSNVASPSIARDADSAAEAACASSACRTSFSRA